MSSFKTNYTEVAHSDNVAPFQNCELRLYASVKCLKHQPRFAKNWHGSSLPSCLNQSSTRPIIGIQLPLQAVNLTFAFPQCLRGNIFRSSRSLIIETAAPLSSSISTCLRHSIRIKSTPPLRRCFHYEQQFHHWQRLRLLRTYSRFYTFSPSVPFPII